jgi:HSP20 family molecular chaperone IbpA
MANEQNPPQRQEQRMVPVRMYQDEDRIMLAAPLPGLQAGDISVRINGRRVTIHGEQRGPAQPGPAVILEEWTPGPYHREVDLPGPVNGTTTNASYGNGVLVLTMPKTGQDETDVRHEFKLEVTEATRGRYSGHQGHVSSEQGGRQTS